MSITLGMALYLIGRNLGLPVVQWGGGAVTLASVSLLFNVVTWYRSEEVINAAILLAVASTLGNMFASWIAIIALTQGAPGGIVIAMGSVFGLPVRILIAILVFGVLVSVGRRLRRFFAPGTLTQSLDGPTSAAYGASRPNSAVTDAQVSDAFERLSRDLRSTGRAADVDIIEHYSTILRDFEGDDPTRFVERLVEDVQQDILDGVEVWPPCPHHPNHPLWYHDGAWYCDQNRTPIAPLGSLA